MCADRFLTVAALIGNMERKHLLTLIRIFVPAVLLSIVLWMQDWGELRGLIVRADYGLLLWAFVLYLIAVFLQGWRWHVLLSSDGDPWPFVRLQRVHFIALFFDLFTPGKIGSDAYRVTAMRRAGKNAHTISSIVALRIHGFAVAVLFAAVAGSVVLGAKHGWVFVIVTIAALVLLGAGLMIAIHRFGAVGASYLLSQSGIRQRIGYHLNRAIEAFNAILSHRRVMLISSVLAVFFMLAIVCVYAAAGHAFHMNLRFVSYLSAVPIFLVASVIPITIQGRGLTEVLAIALWAEGPSGATAEQVVLTCLAVYAVQLGQGLIGGLVWGVETWKRQNAETSN